MRYDARALVSLFVLIVLAIIIYNILKGILAVLLPLALVIFAAYIVYRIIRKV